MKKLLTFLLELVTPILVFFRYDTLRIGRLIAKDWRKFQNGYRLNRGISERLNALVDGTQTHSRHRINLIGDRLANKVQRIKTWS